MESMGGGDWCQLALDVQQGHCSDAHRPASSMSLSDDTQLASAAVRPRFPSLMG